MIDLLLIIIAVEAITEIIIDGDIFIKPRNWLAKLNPGFLGKLLGCGYCLSVWIAIPFGIIYSIYPNTIYYKVMMITVLIFIIHRLSNIIHDLFKRWFLRQPLVLHLLKQKVKVPSEGLQLEDTRDESKSNT